ncbi:hypothetical protein H2198_006542 [Neophaeococcomyces mojaviensis]|uniref:Uncharacterized protein n=1 Tax=Neophaeococcomyces mojaviensis TaxID=3383035 RepID=A0ACC3A2L4_9EURO|nr:hypothetical protein H2198_006542 [Knufia sp. JES_112]
MGFWPFGGGKKQRATEPGRQTPEKAPEGEPSETMGRLEKAGTDLGGDPKSTTKKDRGIRRLSKARTSSTEQAPRSQTDPVAAPDSRRQSRNAQQLQEKPLYQHNPTSQSSFGPENFTVVRQPPTLYARRPDYDPNVARRKPSKRKAEDSAREREVRAMSSSPIPIPPRQTSFYNSGPLQRETKQIHGGLNRKLHRPTSQVSLPLPEPIPGIDDLSHQHSFKVGMFAALSPRPTIKYDANPRTPRGKQPQRPNPLTRPPIFEEEGADKKRIDELADDLDAGGLRELMERDKRRRERKKEQDRLKLQRKLQKRAERQREEEAARQARTEEYVSQSASRVGLGIEPSKSEAIEADEGEAGPSGTRRTQEQNPFDDPKIPAPTSSVAIRNPFEDEKDIDVMRYESSDHEHEPIIPARSPLRKIQTGVVTTSGKPSQAALSPPVSPVPRAEDRQSMSQGSLLNREVTTDIPENASQGRASDHSSQRLSSWTTFFKRGTRRKLSSSFQGRSTPSEFSNTSRESFAARKQPPPAVTPRTFRRADSATPQRTMSKFREDLPELPISPPDSRLQSPEATIPSQSGLSRAIAAANPSGAKAVEPEASVLSPSSFVPPRMKTEQEASMEFDAASGVRPEMTLSQSLASVDSEGSWLSGKPLNRLSRPSQQLKPSRSSLTRPMPAALDSGVDTSPPADDSMEKEHDVRRESAQPEKGDETWHAGVGRQPTLVRQASRAKSKEGLLNEYAARDRHDSNPDSDEEGRDTGEEEIEAPEPTVMRARSVEYKSHARHISGGSARLLDIRRRSSVHSNVSLDKQRRSASQDQLSKQPPPPPQS